MIKSPQGARLRSAETQGHAVALADSLVFGRVETGGRRLVPRVGAPRGRQGPHTERMVLAVLGISVDFRGRVESEAGLADLVGEIGGGGVGVLGVVINSPGF